MLSPGLCEVDQQNEAGYSAIMLAALAVADAPEDVGVAVQLMRLGDVNAHAGQVIPGETPHTHHAHQLAMAAGYSG